MHFSKIQILLLLGITIFALAVGHAQAELLFVPTDNKARIVEAKVAPRPPDHFRRRRPTIWRQPRPTDLPFRVTSSRVDVRIEGNVANTTITQSFLNLSGRPLEVRVMIPLPKGAAISKSALSMGDQMVEGKLYNAREARRIYQTIVSRRRDPALLRFVGENLYEARIFPVPPNQERRLKFSYDQILKPIGELYQYRHILAGSQLYRRGVEQFRFECVIRSHGQSALGPVYSPSHTVRVERPNPKTAIVKFDSESLSTNRDFQLYFSPSSDDVALRLIAHRERPDEDGYFMLIGRPDDQLQSGRVLPKEVVFVLDTSGSMAGEKIEQAKKTLRFCLNQLNARDRFNLVTFSTEVKALSTRKMWPADRDHVRKALAAVETIEATGGTDIDGALRTALANDFTPGPSSAKIVLFLTDGRPSIGVTDSRSILKDLGNFNESPRARVFVFGVGTDVNTHLLDRIALDCAGTSAYVAPKEDLEVKVSDFYAKIKNPVMTDLALDFGTGAKTHSVYPRRLPALFKGSEVLLFGRFKGTGPGAVVLKGNVAGQARTIRMNVEWPAQERGNDFLPRVWAMRKIGHLLEEIRLYGSNRELIGEVVALSQRHGIVTPYTSQLVLEPGMNANNFNRPGWRRRLMAPAKGRAGGLVDDRVLSTKMEEARREIQDQAGRVARRANQQKSGDMAVALAETEKLLKEAKTVSAAAPVPAAKMPAKPGEAGNEKAKKRHASEQAAQALRRKAFLAGGKRDKGVSVEEADERAEMLDAAQALSIKHVGGRTFYLRGGVWLDSTFKARKDKQPIEVKTFSKEYFALLKKHPELGAVFALGENILLVVDGQAYRVKPAK